MSINNLKERFTEIENKIDEIDINELEEKIYTLEENVVEEIEFCLPSEKKELKNLLKKITDFKKENDFYNADSELDRMFPNRHDEDFDEDSMS